MEVLSLRLEVTPIQTAASVRFDKLSQSEQMPMLILPVIILLTLHCYF